MNYSLKCSAIAPSITLEIDAKAKAMKAAGEDVIGLGAGEPDFDTPEFIKDAAKTALDKGLTKYTPASGTLELRKAICEKLEKENNLKYKPSQIVVSNGAKHSLFNAFSALLNPGEEVIVPSPYWVTYPELIKFAGGVPVFVESKEEDEFAIKADAIAEAITEKTKIILLNSPSNPCGAVISKEELTKIADLAKKHDLAIVSDEIYEYLIYDNNKHISIANISQDAYERTIIVNGFSKSYAMTGWRLGYTASNETLAKMMGSLQSHVTSNPNSIAQFAGAAALNGSRDEVDAMVKKFDERRKLFTQKLNEIDSLSCLTPKGAFYIMLNLENVIGKKYDGKTINGSMDFCDMLLESKKVAAVPGIAFGADGYCRLSYATSNENILKAVERINEFVKELN